MKYLVVEDVCMVRKLILNILSPYGNGTSVENGREALIQFNHAWLNEDRFDAIFLDLMLPEINGEEVLKQIRDLEKYWKIDSKNRTKVIIVSALSDFSHVKKAVQNHCDAYITKPFDKKIIIETIEKLGLIN